MGNQAVDFDKEVTTKVYEFDGIVTNGFYLAATVLVQTTSKDRLLTSSVRYQSTSTAKWNVFVLYIFRSFVSSPRRIKRCRSPYCLMWLINFLCALSEYKHSQMECICFIHFSFFCFFTKNVRRIQRCRSPYCLMQDF